ncbi:reverse transcriptase zinc-binding domain-containing protein [Tanacetum coccineum]
MNSQPKNQFEHVDDFDIDDSDLRPTAALRPCNREYQTRDTIYTTRNLVPSTQTPEIDYFDEMAVRIISGPADYIGKLIKDVGEDVDFTRGPWVSAVEYEGGITTGCFGNMKPKWETSKGFGNAITVGAALILKNVAMFSPKQSPHYLNITMTNVVKVFLKDIVLGDGTGVGGSGVLDEEEIIKLLEEKKAKEHQMRLNQEVLIHTLEEEVRANQEWEDKLRQQQESNDEHEECLFGFDF